LGVPWPIYVLHLWFVHHLLLYSLLYALWRRLRPHTVEPVLRPTSPPGYGAVLAFAAGLPWLCCGMRTSYGSVISSCSAKPHGDFSCHCGSLCCVARCASA
jgi:hypothetical protein